jgi:hypothetical protein
MFGTFLRLAGLIILVGIGGLILFLLLDIAWAAWGFFGALLLFGGALALFAWLYDRRHASREY